MSLKRYGMNTDISRAVDMLQSQVRLTEKLSVTCFTIIVKNVVTFGTHHQPQSTKFMMITTNIWLSTKSFSCENLFRVLNKNLNK